MPYNPQVTIDRAALRHNLRHIKACAQGSRVLAVIKADAYGHGLVRVARALDEADALAVARLDEALTLRKAGIEQRIVILQGFVDSQALEAIRAHRLEPVIHSGYQVEMLEQLDVATPLTVWMKLDTGMHRLGFLPAEFPVYHERLSRCRAVAQPVTLMTHLARADDWKHPATDKQLDVFRRTLKNREGEQSIANSAGILAWNEAHTHWIRPGIALYGVSPFPNHTGEEEGLKPVMTFHTRLIAIKSLAVGATVGYGGHWTCRRPTRMGVAAVGYGDGYPRHVKSGTPVLVRGLRVPLMGRVSMDMINLDLTDCPDATVGDEVILWGEDLPVEEIADHADTIPYTLLCGVMPRVRRVER